jgi:predicted RNase H-like HicB family nuclease
MKKDIYVYPAIFSYEDNGISIVFPDLDGCCPCGSTTEEAIKNAKESLALHLYGMEESGLEIPEPTPANNIKVNANDMLYLTEVYMPLFRDAIENAVARITVTLPSWLKTKSVEENLNFSHILQDALKYKLGIKG